MSEDRKNSVGQVATGATLFAAGMGGSHLLDERLKRKKAKGPIRAAVRSAQRKPGGFKVGTHLPHVAGKLGSRGLQAVGLPLAAYGAANAVRPKPKPTKRLDAREVTRDVARHATLQDQVELGETIYGRPVRKTLTSAEERKLDTRRKVGRTLSLASGTMGLTALGLRAPAAAKVAVKRGVKRGAVVRLAGKEQAATAHSNTLGVMAIGTGSAGSFNYASQQKLERKKDAVAKAKVPGMKVGTKLVGDVAERLTHTRLPGSVRVRRPPTKSAQPDPRKGLRQRVSDWGDRRAENLMDEIVPWDYETSGGVRRGQATIATSRDGSGKAVVHLGGKERRIPLARQVQVPLERQGPRGGQHDVGYVNAVVWPTKHVNISGMKIRQSEKGKGTGTELLNTTLSNIRRAKTPGMVWQAGEYSEDVGRAVPKGVTMWRKPGIDYLPGMPVAPGSARRMKNPPVGKPKTPGEARAQAWAQMNTAERREVRAHTRAARTGRAKPTDVASMSPNSQRYMSDQPWYARVPGGQPFLGRTRRAAAGGAVAGGAAYGGGQWQEHQHPRGYGGTFRSKGGVSKGLPSHIFHAGKKRRVLHYDQVKGLIRLDGDYVVRRGGAKPPKEPKPPEQMQLPFGKAEDKRDRFLRGYSSRISPDAERGYRTLKHGRNQQAAQAAGAATMAGLGGWLTHHEVSTRPRNKPAVAVTAASTLASAYTAASNAAGAHRYDRKMGKIKAKARSRRAQGLYGPGRGLTPVDDTSARARNLAKSMGAAR